MKPPVHLWIIGVVTLLWNSGGVFDFVMTNSQNAAYLSNFTPDQLVYFTSFPTWITLVWGIATFGALLGSILLLMRSRHAVIVFTLSFLGMIANMFYGYFLSGTSMTKLMGPGAAIFSAVIVLVGLLLVLYSRTMRQRGVLR